MDTTNSRLVLHSTSHTTLADVESYSDFWNEILEDFLPAQNLEEPRLIPLEQTIHHLRGLMCTTVIVQHQIQDPDFTAEYLAYHGRVFPDINRFCTRIHCFTIECENEKDVIEAIDEAANDEYLGFITLRPVKSSPVGATILRPPSNTSHFLLSKDEFEVHLAGKRFTVTGTPFMQQDNAVGACAQASIWMALRTLRKREGLAAHNPAQITTSATRFFVQGRTLPNRDGLVISQMMEAVRSAGYSPTLLRFREPYEKPATALLPSIKTSIYPYIESETPVILVMITQELGGHAVVLIGHGWDVAPSSCSPVAIMQEDNITYVPNAVDWVSPFYIHNDNSGPYLPIPDTASKWEYSLDKVCYAIPLLPSDVYMSAEEAEQAALRMFGYVTNGSFLDNKKHVVRTYLQERYRFRETIVNSNIAETAKRYYRMKAFPKRVWVTEINQLDGYESSAESKSQRIGEIVIDPTTEPTQAPFLSIHYPDVIIDRHETTGIMSIIFVANDTPYTQLVR